MPRGEGQTGHGHAKGQDRRAGTLSRRLELVKGVQLWIQFSVRLWMGGGTSVLSGSLKRDFAPTRVSWLCQADLAPPLQLFSANWRTSLSLFPRSVEKLPLSSCCVRWSMAARRPVNPAAQWGCGMRDGMRDVGTECGTLRPDAPGARLSPAMPQQARLEAPDALHHVRVRGLERRLIFRDDRNRV